jgi:hypothetical protein
MDTEDNQSTTKTTEPKKACRLHQRQATRPPEITIEILKAATSFFVRESDPRNRR